MANKLDVLETLRKNRETHSAIVKEARVGYVERAKKEVEKKLAALAAGKVVSLSFSLHVPLDYTKVYDTAIRMLEIHTEEKVKLDASQVRNLMQDEWDWTDSFYGTNSVYSSTANHKKVDSEDDVEIGLPGF